MTRLGSPLGKSGEGGTEEGGGGRRGLEAPASETVRCFENRTRYLICILASTTRGGRQLGIDSERFGMCF